LTEEIISNLLKKIENLEKRLKILERDKIKEKRLRQLGYKKK